MTIPTSEAIGRGRVSWELGVEVDRGHLVSLSIHQQVLAALRRNLSGSESTGFHRLSSSADRELHSLVEESDSQIFYSDLLHWARRQQGEGQLARAVLVYELLSGEVSDPQGLLEIPGRIREGARKNLAVLRGGGSLGERLEFQGGRFIDGVFSPPLILGMAVGSTVFTGTRSLLLPRLWGHSARNFLTAGLGARLTASSVALTAEGLAFWGVSKGMESYLHPGSQRWDQTTNLQEIASLMMTLGFLRTSGFAFSRTHQWAAQASRSSGATHLTQALGGGSSFLWHQGGMFTGILMSQGVEQRLGWRDSQALDGFLLDSLITLVQFNAAGALSQRVFPGLYHLNGQQETRLRLQEQNQWRNVTQTLPRFPGGEGMGLGPWGSTFGFQAQLVNGHPGGPWQVRPSRGNFQARDLYLLSSTLEGGEGNSGAGPNRPGTFRQQLRRVKDIPDAQDVVEALSLLYIGTVGELRPLMFESLVAVRENQATSDIVVSALLKNPRLNQTDFFSPAIRQKVWERLDFLTHREIPQEGGRVRQPTPVDQSGLSKISLSNLNVSELLLRLHRFRLEEFSQGLQEGNLSISQRDAAQELAVLARYFDEAVAKHERNAETDFLTGLLNKRGLERITPRLENRLHAYNEFTGGEKKADWVLMIDIDHFKKVNDTYGHPNGDEVLRRVAQTLRNSVRYRDISARIGGEEFFILLAKAGQDGAARVAESLRQAVSEKSITLSDFDPIRVTVSVGAAPMRTVRSILGPGEWTAEGALFDAKERADRALYEAKNSGRNRVQISREGRIPWNKIKQRPTIVRFNRLLEEVAIPPEEFAMELNWKFSPRINLARYPSYSGRAIYISDSVDEAKLKHYGRLDYQSLGEILFFARKDLSRHWTVTEAAQPERLNIRREHLSDIERNQSKPSDEELESFSKIYGLEGEALREARDRTRFRRRLQSQF